MDARGRLIELERRYLAEALTQCRKCYADSIDNECTQTCSERYVQFMQLKQFVLVPNPRLSLKDVERVELLLGLP